MEEAQAGQSRPDFVSKCSIARKEVRETRYWLRILKAKLLIEPALAASLIRECEELKSILTAIIKNMTKPKSVS
jgi:four helix bundle protein